MTERITARLIIKVNTATEHPPVWVDHDLGIFGLWDGRTFTVPFESAMTAEEVARIISRALTREEDTNGV